MKQLLLSMIILCSLNGCAQSKTVKFKTDTFMSAGKEQKFEVQIPKGYKMVSDNLDIDLFKHYQYPDGSSLYISLDINYSNSPNKNNWSKCSNAITGKKCEQGEQENGLLWREILKDNLVIGYFGVSKERKDEFDKSITSLGQKN